MVTTSTQTSNVDRTIPTRRMSFEESLAVMPKHFAADGNVLLSHLAASLSSVFPDGEDFFVRSVRHYRDQITDPVLKKQVNGFIGQEAMHGREHRVFNDRLAELGYGTKLAETFTRKGLELRTKVAPAKANLAATAALEHFTATLAELVLSSEETQELFGHDGVRELFLWHALEECEHKAVAFDVYKAVGGTERMRVWTMKFLRYGFVSAMVVQIVLGMLFDKATYERGALRKSWRSLRTAPIFRKELWQQLKDYERPDFHPDDSDSDELLETWRAKLFGPEGTLNGKLVGAAA